MNKLRRRRVIGLLLMMVSPVAFAAEIPGTDGKLDYGLDHLPIPDPIYRNATSPRTVELLAAAASEETIPFEKMRLLTELGECRMPQGVPALVRALSDQHPGVRATAAHAIAIAGADDTRSEDARKALLANSEAIGRLQQLASDADPEVAAAAVVALGTLQGPTSPAIEAALRSSVVPVLSAGISLASRPEHAAMIAGRLDSIPTELRAPAILAIGRCGDQAQGTLLVNRATGDNVVETVAACQALAMLKHAPAAGQLEKLTRAAHPSVRREAMRAFGQCSADRHIELATAMLADNDPTVRQAAVEVIGDNLVADAVASLIPQLSTDYRPLYLATRKALISAKDDATREACIQAAGRLIGGSDPRRQEDGSYVLGQYRSPHMLERHIELLDYSAQDVDWRVIEQAALSTGRIGRQEAREALVKIVMDRPKLLARDRESARAINAAIIGAGRLGASEILPMCDRILAEDPLNSDGNARLAAAFAIGTSAKPDDKVVSRLFASLGNMMDMSKSEAVKAIGNLKVPGAEKRIQTFVGSDGYEMQWLIQWATARITGQPAEHPPTEYPFTFRPSIHTSDLER